MARISASVKRAFLILVLAVVACHGQQTTAESGLGTGFNGLRICRLGTIEFPVNPQNPVRWLVVLTKEWSNALRAIFGTYYYPEDKWPEAYGLDNEKIPGTFWGQALYPFSRKKAAEPAARAG